MRDSEARDWMRGLSWITLLVLVGAFMAGPNSWGDVLLALVIGVPCVVILVKTN